MISAKNLILNDGRTISYSVIGDGDFSRTIIYFHGLPGSAAESYPSEKIAQSLGVTIVALNRPGIGASTYRKYDHFSELVPDVESLLSELKIEKFSILGISGGTPYAVATAAALADRVNRLAIVSGVGDLSDLRLLRGMNRANRFMIRLMQRSSYIGGLSASALGTLWRRAPLTVALWFSAVLPKVDLDLVKRPSIGQALQSAMREALSPGVRGVRSELERLVRPWSVDFSSLNNTTALVLHGDQDTYVPQTMAQQLKERLPQVELRIVPGAGHFMIFDMLEEVIKWSSEGLSCGSLLAT